MASCSGACFSAFLFSSPCPSTAAVQRQRHPRPGGMDCVQGLVFHDELSLGWGGNWQMSPGHSGCPLSSLPPLSECLFSSWISWGGLPLTQKHPWCHQFPRLQQPIAASWALDFFVVVGPGHWADQVHERFLETQVQGRMHKGNIKVPVPTDRT